MTLPRNILVVIASAALPLSALSAPAGPEPILSYNFNTAGETAVSTGSDGEANLTLKNGATYSAAGSGISGAAADRALDLTNTAGMGVPPGGIATRKGLPSLAKLSSFTLTGWFKTAGDFPINYASRLLDAGSSFFLGGAEHGNLTLGVNGKNAILTGNRFGTTQSWVFFAVSYDGTKPDKNVKFYAGTIDSPATLMGNALDLPAGEIRRVGVFNLGNREFNNFDRPFHGLLDDIKVFGASGGSDGALDLPQIQKVQLQSLRPAR